LHVQGCGTQGRKHFDALYNHRAIPAADVA
jgi:hypothetical protein